MSNELKPVRCGCGGEAVIDAEMGYELYHVFCPKCEIVTAWYKTEAEAIEAWNTAMGTNTRKLLEVLVHDATDTNVGCKERTAKVINIYSVGNYLFGSCGGCGAPVIKHDVYCSECGVKLDWSGNERFD